MPKVAGSEKEVKEDDHLEGFKPFKHHAKNEDPVMVNFPQHLVIFYPLHSAPP